MRAQVSQTGFTLLEVMVAISIFAVLGLGAYRLLNGEVRTQKRVQAHSETLQHWQRALHRLGQDIVQLSPRPVRDNYDEVEPALSGTGDSLTLTRSGWPNPLARPRSHSQRVRYELGHSESDADGRENFAPQFTLVRSYWRALDRAQDSEPQQQALLPGVESLSFRYLDSDGEWQNQWPPFTRSPQPTLDAALPVAIEIRLANRSYGEISRLYAVGDLHREPKP